MNGPMSGCVHHFPEIPKKMVFIMYNMHITYWIRLFIFYIGIRRSKVADILFVAFTFFVTI